MDECSPTDNKFTPLGGVNSYWKNIERAALNSTLTTDTKTYASFDAIIDALVEIFEEVKREDRAVAFIGNGGSAAIAMHMTVDFFKNGGMRTYSLYNPATLTCLSNDFGYEYVFSKQLETLQNGDLLVAVSSSGESKNILNAVETAKNRTDKIISLSGFKEDNSLSRSGFCRVYVPSNEYGVVESVHNLILQQVVDEIKKRG